MTQKSAGSSGFALHSRTLQLRSAKSIQTARCGPQSCEVKPLTPPLQVVQDPPKTIAMPYMIGCARAGWEWPGYLSAIEDFASAHRIDVRLYDIHSQARVG